MTMITADVARSCSPASDSSLQPEADTTAVTDEASLPPALRHWLQGDDALAASASSALAHLPRKSTRLEVFQSCLQRTQSRTGSVTSPLSPVEAKALCSLGWHGTLAAAVLSPAWCLPAASPLADLPAPLWGAYTIWLFALEPGPADLTEAEVFARHLLRFTTEVAAWAERNLGSPSIRAAVDAYLAAKLPDPASLPLEHVGPWQLARARILARVHGRADAAQAIPFASPPTDRPLRVGIVKHDFDASPSTSLVRARFGQLDPARFETVLYATQSTYSESETACCDCASDLRLLPDRLGDQVEFLRTEALDVVLLADDLARHTFPAAHLALYRFAPLQVALASSSSIGLPGIDLLLTGENDALAARPTAAADRLAVLPGTIHAYDFTCAPPDDGATFDRARWGIPPDAALIVTTLADDPIDLGAIERLHRLHLARAEAHFLFIDTRLSIDAVMPAQLADLIDSGRGHVYPSYIDDTAAMRLALGAADVAVELSAASAALAFEALTPVVSCSPASRPDPVAGLLITAELGDWIAPDVDTWLVIVQKALTDRPACSATLARASARVPRFADPFATAQDFGLLVEAAVAEHQSESFAAARRNRQPLRATTLHSVVPDDLQAAGLRLLEAGDVARAVPYLLAAINRNPGKAQLWFELARAYLFAGAPENALSTLEASLRLDESNAPAWIMLAQLAADVESLELAREALDCAIKLEPDHPELPALRARLAA
jgi:protein O-GlcNAc transferase